MIRKESLLFTIYSCVLLILFYTLDNYHISDNYIDKSFKSGVNMLTKSLDLNNFLNAIGFWNH